MSSNPLNSSPHLSSDNSIQRIMLTVLLALIPGIIAQIYFFGWGVIINLVIAGGTALLSEFVMLKLRARPAMPFLLDGSALLTAALIAVALPPFAPWWLVFIGTAFAIVVAKQLYGGLGFNPFNPAMVGYAMLLIAFPKEMTIWLPAATHELSFNDSLRYSLYELLPAGRSLDAVSMATPLDMLKTQLNLDLSLAEISRQYAAHFGHIGGYGWEWVNLMFLMGGLVLIMMRVITWHIPVAFLASFALMSLLFYLVDPQSHGSPLFHLFSGATMLGAFFIATDPVTASTTPRGRLIYGAAAGLLVYVIRSFGGYPDAVAFAILLMNTAAPTIDYYTQPRVFGHGKK